MLKPNTTRDDTKDKYHLCEDDYLLRAAYNTGSYLRSYYEATEYKRTACSQDTNEVTRFTLGMYQRTYTLRKIIAL